MRKLMWFSLGFAPACAVYVYLLPGGLTLPMALVSLALAGCFLAQRRRKHWIRAACALCLGFGIGSLWCWGYDALLLNPVRALDGYEGPVTMELTAMPQQGAYSVQCQGNLTAGGVTATAVLYLPELDEAAAVGDQVTGTAQLRWSQWEDSDYRYASGVLLVGTLQDAALTHGDSAWRYWPERLQQRLLTLADTLFPADCRGFLRAVLLGDRSGITAKQASDLSAVGLSHVVAVSGMHLSIFFSVVCLLLGKTRKWLFLLEIGLALVFAAVVGFTPSVTRAALMQGIILGALALDRPYDPPTSLAAAALGILAVKPMAIASVSFQLSFGAVAGIFLVAGRMSGYLRKLLRVGSAKAPWRRAVATSVSVTLGALLFTIPLTALHFHSFSLLSVISNLLSLWAVSAIFQGALAALALGAVWLPLGQAIAWCCAWLVRYFWLVVQLCAKVPGGVWYTSSALGLGWLILAYGLLALFALDRCRKPGVLVSALVLSWCLCLLGSYAAGQSRAFRVTVLNVGQGQCVILQWDGKTYMVDCGGDQAGEAAVQYLARYGIFRLDALILTHYDADHCNGVAELLYRIPADTLYLPAAEDTRQILPEILTAAQHAKIFRVSQDLTIQTSHGMLRLFAPMGANSDNDNCLTALLSVGAIDTLITGDLSTTGELRLLAQQDLPDVEVLIVGHHGSANSTGPGLLWAVTPEIAVISVGENNYGHPSPKVLQRLQDMDCQILRTDQQGTIVIEH